MNTLFIKVLAVFLLAFTTHVAAVDLMGVINSHDPATLTKDGDVYWQFTTGDGIWSSYSTNLSYWTASNKPVFAIGTWPTWINTYVPGFGGNFWAPDVIYMNSAYYLYYSCSTWGSSQSAIGVVRTASLNDPVWQDMGKVVSSNGSSAAINAIDPGLFKDDDGKVYMTYGSWFGGIGIMEIDTVTGKATTGTTHIYG
jgi:arabinan endo-1,5-alpha-L-arabinosidase